MDSSSLRRHIHSHLQECITHRNIQKGRELQDLIDQNDLANQDPLLYSNLIRLFDICGSLQEAIQAFGKISKPSISAWSSIILAYANHGESENAIRLFYQMQKYNVKPNSYAFVASFKACSHMVYPHHGMLIHGQSIVNDFDKDLYVTNSIIDMYVKCGLINDAERVFERSSDKSVTTWSSMIKGYAQHHRIEEAFSLFDKMQINGIMPNNVTFICILKACSSLDKLEKGKIIHDHVKRSCYASDEMVGNTLIGMYMQCGSVNDAIQVFNELPKNNIITWNAMISGYFQNGFSHKAVKLFDRMQVEGVNPNKVTFASILKACANTLELEEGRKVYMKFIMNGTKCDAFVESTLVDMYMQCGSINDARGIFDKLVKKELVTWCTMISGLVHRGYNFEALSLLSKMQGEGTDPNEITFVCILTVCGNTGAAYKGQEIHDDLVRQGFEKDLIVGNSLIDMYANCGSLDNSKKVFEKLLVRNIISWTALISGFALLGDVDNAFLLFNKMIEEGQTPNSITFISILNACSHGGQIDEGQMYFHTVSDEFGIDVSLEHYSCLIDLLGRSGQIDNAILVIERMPFHPNLVLWHTLLGACRKWADLNLGKRAFHHVVEYNEEDGVAYVSMSNLYADMGEMEED